MMVTWVEIDGAKEAIESLQDLTKFKKSQEYKSFQTIVSRRSNQYWKDNIYNYFDARLSYDLDVTGQLGNSLKTSVATYRVTFSMKPIRSPIDGSEYGHYLREGFGPSPGEYWPTFDRRMKFGMHPGYDSNTRWVPWMRDFRRYVSRMSGRQYRESIDKFIRRSMS